MTSQPSFFDVPRPVLSRPGGPRTPEIAACSACDDDGLIPLSEIGIAFRRCSHGETK